MSNHSKTRRVILKGAAGLIIAPAWHATAFADTKTQLKAGITGYDVMNTLDPAKAALVPEFYIIYAVFNGLLGLNPDMSLRPELAESWEVSEDGSLKFNLRKGVKFQNGDEFTAEDVAFSLERIMDPDISSPSRNKLDSIDRIEIIDPHTVKLHTKHPFAPLL